MAGKLKRGGKRRGAGRKRGSTNIIPREVKQMVINALNEAGGEDYLLNIAKTDPKTFCGLIGRVIPLQHEGSDENPLNVAHTIRLVAGGRDTD